MYTMTARMFSLMRVFALLWALADLTYGWPAAADPSQPIDVIEDNSFLIEEAYNQEAGVVQHIFTAQWGENRDAQPHQRGWRRTLTQEWPILSSASPVLLLHSVFLHPRRRRSPRWDGRCAFQLPSSSVGRKPSDSGFRAPVQPHSSHRQPQRGNREWGARLPSEPTLQQKARIAICHARQSGLDVPARRACTNRYSTWDRGRRRHDPAPVASTLISFL